MQSKFASTETRLSHLENICALQQALINQLHVAILGHQHGIELIALAVGIELQQPAQHTAPSTMN